MLCCAMKKHPIHHLQLRVRELGQLFNSLDPSPFLNKDLDREAEVFIESWAQGLPSESHLHITVHLQHLPTEGDAAGLITEAIHNYFSYKAGLVRGELHRLLREGRTSLLIGISFLTVCLLAADASKEIVPGTHFAVAREGLTILGWVALWRPLQIFLYDWWPLARKMRVCRALGRAVVRVVTAQP